MQKILINKEKIKNFNKTIRVSGDKSLSIRWILLASLASGVSRSKFAYLGRCFSSNTGYKKIRIKVILIIKNAKFMVRAWMGTNIKKYSNWCKKFRYTARLLPGLLINSTHKIKIIGDESLSKRDFKRSQNL